MYEQLKGQPCISDQGRDFQRENWYLKEQQDRTTTYQEGKLREQLICSVKEITGLKA